MSTYNYFVGKLNEKVALFCKETLYGRWAKSHTFRLVSEDSNVKLCWSRSVEETLRIRPAITNSGSPLSSFRVGAHKIAALDFYIKEEVRFLGSYCTPVDNEGNLLAYAILPESYQHFLLHVDLASLLRATTRHWSSKQDAIPLGFSLVNAWSRSYFHWFVEILPRFVFLLDWFDHIDDTNLIIERVPNGWQVRALELLGILPENILYGTNHPLFVKELLVPPHSHQRVDNIGVFVPSMLESLRCRILRSKLRTGDSNQWKPNIYISRRKAVGRRVTNEKELIQKLSRLGFGAYCLEDMTLDEQISLFSQAELIVAPHGAGLTNILWAKNATIVELFGAYWNPSFFTLANILNHRYLCFQSADRHPENQKNRFQVFYKRQDFAVNTGELLHFLQRNV